MPDVVIENAIRTLKQRRDEIDAIIKSMERVAGGLLAEFSRPGWKPKKK